MPRSRSPVAGRRLRSRSRPRSPRRPRSPSRRRSPPRSRSPRRRSPVAGMRRISPTRRYT